MAIVECPVFSLSSRTSCNVLSGVRFESLITKPALYFLTLRIISASLSIDCEQYINDIPPFLARDMAMLLSETDCMTADEKGMFNFNSGSSPFLYLQIGVLKSTFSTIQSFVVRFGRSKYSPNVLEGSLTIFAMLFLLFICK
jgi:hypothetical protein